MVALAVHFSIGTGILLRFIQLQAVM